MQNQLAILKSPKVASARKMAVMAATALGGALLVASPAGAATYSVNNQVACSNANVAGTPFCTIAGALAVAMPGDTVLVEPGTYGGLVRITRDGTSSAPIVVSANGAVVVTSSSYGFDLAGSAWVKVDGFTVNTTTYDGIRCTTCTNVLLTGNTVKKANGKGISVNSSADVTLTNNNVEDSRLSGIDVAGSTRISITGGYVTRAGLRQNTKSYKGIKLATTTNSLIEGVEVYNNSDTGVYILTSSTGNRVKNVVAYDNARVFDRAAAGVEIRSPNNIVEGVIAYTNEDSGINLRWGGNDSLVINNVTYRNGDHGIDVLESTSPDIINNSVYRNATAGINVEGSSPNAVIKNNISVDNGIGSTRTYGNIRVTTSSMPATANSNIVFSSVGGSIYHWNGTYYSKLTTVMSANPGVETLGLQVSPAWADQAANNFQLTSGSAAIDSADSNAISGPEIDVDLLGTPRCDDTNQADTGIGNIRFADRGALEFTGACAP